MSSSYLFLLIILYLAYTSIKGIVEQLQGGLPLETPHWVMIGMLVLFIPVVYLLIKRIIKEARESKGKKAEEQEKLEQEAYRRKRELYYNDDDAANADDASTYEAHADASPEPVELTASEQEVVEDLEEEIDEVVDISDGSGFNPYDE